MLSILVLLLVKVEVFAKQKVIQFSFKNGVSALPKEASLMFHEPIELPQCMPLIYQVIARVGRWFPNTSPIVWCQYDSSESRYHGLTRAGCEKCQWATPSPKVEGKLNMLQSREYKRATQMVTIRMSVGMVMRWQIFRLMVLLDAKRYWVTYVYFTVHKRVP